MAANKRKILENARKLAQKGAKDKALKEYQKLVRLDPKDAKLRLEIGDAYRRWGQVDDAIDTYTKVADQYMKEGFDARAVAVHKQILNLDPERHESYPPLADLYERMGLTAEAIGALQTAADGYHREGKKKEALELLRRMSSIDPGNTTSRIKVAELLRQEGMDAEALVEYEEVAAELTRQGDVEAAGKVYRRILEMDPERPATLAAFSRNLLAQDLASEAETVAKRALAADEENPDQYELLADVYRAQKRDDLLPEVYRPMAELLRRRGDEDKARDILQRFVPAEAMSVDGDAEVFDNEPVEFLDGGDDIGLGGEPQDELSLDGSSFGDPAPTDELELGPELEIGAQDDALELSSPVVESPESEPLELEDPAGATISSMEPQGPVAAQPEVPEPITGDPDQLMAEASVYLRYGKRDRAIAHLEAILAQEARHRGALEKLGEAHAESGDDADAVRFWLQAAGIAQDEGDADAVAVLRDRIQALDPAAAATLPGGHEPEPEPEAGSELDLDLEPDLEESSEPEVSQTADAVEPVAAQEPADESDFDLDIDIDDPLEASDDDEFLDEPAPVAAAPEPATPGPQTSSNGSLSTTTAQQIQEDLEEADFYMEQGLHGEAEEIYQRVLALAPNHPKALLRLGEVAAARGEDPGSTGGGPAQVAESSEETPAPDASDALPLEPPVSDAAESEDEAPVPIDVEAPEDALDLGGDLAVEEEDVDPVDEDTGSPIEVADAPEEPAPPEEETGEFSVPTQSVVDRPAPASPGQGGEAGFDLAAELSDVFDDDENGASHSGADDGFAAVFDAFKKGVSQTLSEADHEAHYDLGIAYKEMELFDDAIQEFRAAMVHPPRVIECLHMIALCGLDGGQHQLAVEHLEQLLETDGVTDDQVLAARFDLGQAHEALGAIPEARAAYEAVAAVDASYQQVGSRLAGLPEAKPDANAEAAPDEQFEDFDDVMSEAASDDEEEVDEAGESFQDLIDEVIAEDEAEPEPEPDPEPAPEPEPVAEAPPKPAPSRAKKRKKISFL